MALDERLLKAAAFLAYAPTKGLALSDTKRLQAWAEALLEEVAGEIGVPLPTPNDADYQPVGVPPWE